MTVAYDPAFAKLTELASGRAGFALAGYKDKCLKRRIAVRMRACGVHTYGDYLALLAHTPAEYGRLADALTINVTQFYRNPEMWDCLRATILPRLLSDCGGRLRAWSAGCASGEEAYTLVMVLADAAARLGRPEWLGSIAVDATDVDRVSLERAGVARYRVEALAHAPGELAQQYGREEQGEFMVLAALRERVTVGWLDLNAALAPQPSYDLILCRNVVIYFDRQSQERLFSALADALSPGGVLVLGKVETLVGAARERLVVVHARERIFRRPA